MSRSELRSIWFWLRAALEVCASTWSGGVISFYITGLLALVEGPHSAGAIVAVLVGMGLGLGISSLVVLRRMMRARSRDPEP